jgi:hypothetical protein
MYMHATRMGSKDSGLVDVVDFLSYLNTVASLWFDKN